MALLDDQVWAALAAVATFAASLVWWILKDLKGQRIEHVKLEREKIEAQHELSTELKTLCHTIAESHKSTATRLDYLADKVDENTTQTKRLAEALGAPVKNAG